MSDNIDETYKSISIRGVDAEIYSQFSNKIKMMGISMGDAITKLMKDVVETFGDKFQELSVDSLKLSSLAQLTIKHQRSVIVTKEELIEGGRSFSFAHCDYLELSSDIDKETFLSHVRSIKHCQNVIIPKSIPKLVSLSRIRFCQNIEFEKEKVEENETEDI